jgi:predicted 2-oxoglutarate/Fe(II)-dependent dioxygenase YbiX
MGGANPPSNLQTEYSDTDPYLRVFHMDGTCMYPSVDTGHCHHHHHHHHHHPLLITKDACTALITHIDETATQQTQTHPATADIRLPISQSELARLIGEAHVQALINLLPTTTKADACEIVLRRCSAHGMCINFHRDNALHTVQVALNGDDQYKGGRLVYATTSGMFTPPRPTGTVTVHNNGIVHGVTKLEEGVRYGLFFLTHRPGL